MQRQQAAAAAAAAAASGRDQLLPATPLFPLAPEEPDELGLGSRPGGLSRQPGSGSLIDWPFPPAFPPPVIFQSDRLLHL